ncbi:hypothetical protein ADUPG1_005163, partial [Aduncisulcus paluster]
DCRIKKAASAEAKKRGFEARKRKNSRRQASQNKGKSSYSSGDKSLTLSGIVSSGPDLGYSHNVEVLPDSGCTTSLIDKSIVDIIHPALHPINTSVELADGSKIKISCSADIYITLLTPIGRKVTFNEECLVFPMKSGTSYRLLLSANTSEKQGLLQFTKLLPKEDAPEEEEEEPEVVAPSFSALNDEGRRIVKDLLDTYWKEVSPEEFARVEPIEFTLKDPDKVFKAAHRHHTLKNTKII